MDPAAVAARMALPIFFFPIRAAGWLCPSDNTLHSGLLCFIAVHDRLFLILIIFLVPSIIA